MTQMKQKGKGFSGLDLFNNTYYNELIIAQEDMVYFHIIEEVNTKDNIYGNERQAWMKLSIKINPTTRASKKLVQKKITKCELDDVKIET